MPRTPLRQASSSSSPPNSSPLNPNYKYNNPPSQRRASFKTQFQIQSRYTRPPQQRVHVSVNPSALSTSDDTPQKALWRERFRRKCAERSERDRAKFKSAKRHSGGMSSPSDSAFDEDADMETEGLDDMDDDLYRRLMISDSQRRARISFTHAMVSSVDPDMENFEELVREFAGPSKYRSESPPPDIDLSDSEPDYPPDAYNNVPFDGSSEMDVDMGMDMSSPPASPKTPFNVLPSSQFLSLLLASPCPFCHAPFSLHHHDESGQPAVLCAICSNVLRLGDAPASWLSVHPSPLPGHNPLAVLDLSLPDSVVVLCSEDACPWGVAL
ncbi:hypothetical protein BS47DRAFT_1346152 [Hydnum rufescens UP504]|uniref:Uncharacterized protein n=1 Tax=Hydnum rufescens UP504 TaxID=1448309 RepID=A0A9P6AUL7_9AGAM|nr:hypothetical protein BS47DRAFT_1346152 [Hydnum rufescens UP504]